MTSLIQARAEPVSAQFTVSGRLIQRLLAAGLLALGARLVLSGVL